MPLSWIYNNDIKDISTTNLILTNRKWLYQASHSGISNKLLKKNNFVIKGCDEKYAYFLQQLGYNKIQSGMEAVLDLSGLHFEKKSLLNVVKRGLKHGNVIKTNFTPETVKKLKELKNNTTYGKLPQLKFHFQTDFNRYNDLFVLENSDKEWLGAVMICNTSGSKAHTELLLRRENAPVGVMEALLYTIYNYLRKKGLQELSLGEVPFISENRNKPFSEVIYQQSGKLMSFAYNYKGLYNFKNKFSPEWHPVYICEKGKVNPLSLFNMGIKSNYFSFVAKKGIKKLLLLGK